MSTSRPALESSLAELTRECDELRELIAAEKRIDNQDVRDIARSAGSLAVRTPKLKGSMVELLNSWQTKRPAVPVVETSQVIHAVAGNFVSRKLLIWALAIVTGLPTLFSIVFLWQQTGFLNRQNQLLTNANRERRSVELQRIIREQAPVGKSGAMADRFGMRARQVAFINYLDFLKSESATNPIANASTLSGLSFPGCFWNGTDFAHAHLAQTTFKNSYFEKCNLSRVFFLYADLSNSTFVDCEIVDSSLGDISDCKFTDCNLFSVSISFVSLKNSVFENCDFTKAEFKYYTPGILPEYKAKNDAAFDEVKFKNCDFSGTTFDEATPVSKAFFENCIYDDATIFPPDFDPDAAGLKRMVNTSESP